MPFRSYMHRVLVCTLALTSVAASSGQQPSERDLSADARAQWMKMTADHLLRCGDYWFLYDAEEASRYLTQLDQAEVEVISVPLTDVDRLNRRGEWTGRVRIAARNRRRSVRRVDRLDHPSAVTALSAWEAAKPGYAWVFYEIAMTRADGEWSVVVPGGPDVTALDFTCDDVAAFVADADDAKAASRRPVGTRRTGPGK